MTIQPVTKTQILSDLHGTLDALSGWNFTWATMANGDTGLPVNFPGNADKSIQVTGTFGAAGSATLQGSNDGTNFFALTNPSGTTIAITSAGIMAVTEACQFVRPAVTAGDGTTALVAVVFARKHSTEVLTMADKASSTDMQRIFDDAKKFAAQFVGFFKAAEVMGSLGSFEQAIDETNARLKAARDGEAKAVAEFEARKKQIAADHADAIAKANTSLGEHLNQAERILREARDGAKVILAEAEAKAVLVREQAQAQVNEVRTQTEKAMADLSTIHNDITDANNALTEVEIEHNERKTALDHLRDEHNAFLAKIGAR